MRDFVLTRYRRGHTAGTAVLLAGMLAIVAAGCSGSPGATDRPTPAGTVPVLASAGSTVSASASAAISSGSATSLPTASESSVVGSSPVAGGLPTGQPITGPSQFANVLAPGDFAALGIADAHAPTVNTTGCAPNCAYVVYNKLSAADGGIEFDIFNYATAADATADFGGGTLFRLADHDVAALGADDAQLLVAQPGNTADISVDELRVLKGKLWFDLGIPSNEKGKSQLLALAALVLARTGPLQ